MFALHISVDGDIKRIYWIWPLHLLCNAWFKFVYIYLCLINYSILITITLLSKGLNFKNWLFPSCHVPFFVSHVNCYSSLIFHLTQTKPLSKECTKWHFSAFRCHFHNKLTFCNLGHRPRNTWCWFYDLWIPWLITYLFITLKQSEIFWIHGNWILLDETIPANNCP